MIRAATLADAEPIARVHVQSWEETYRGKLPDHTLDVRPLPVRIRQWREWLSDDRRFTIVHVRDGRVDAFASAFPSDEEPGYAVLLSTLYVLKQAQRGGVARALLRDLATRLTRNGMNSMWLLTLRDDNPARGFYERVGARFLREQPAPAVLGEGVMDVVYGFPDIATLL
jgi:GNAT superfamily N-acetyltransferase